MYWAEYKNAQLQNGRIMPQNNPLDINQPAGLAFLGCMQLSQRSTHAKCTILIPVLPLAQVAPPIHPSVEERCCFPLWGCLLYMGVNLQTLYREKLSLPTWLRIQCLRQVRKCNDGKAGDLMCMQFQYTFVSFIQVGCSNCYTHAMCNPACW